MATTRLRLHFPTFAILNLLVLLVAARSSMAAWTQDGNVLCNAVNGQHLPVSCPDGAGGAIIAWYDYRNNGSSARDIYVQRVDEQGAPQWTANGVALCTASGDQFDDQIVSDGAGGAIVVWEDYRSGTDIYAQRVNAAGTPLWTGNGVVVCNVAGGQYIPAIVSDGASGAIIAWRDFRGSNFDIYAQRVNSAGAAQWTAGGVAIAVVTNQQDLPQLASDGANGAIIAWEDSRTTGITHPYGQRVNSLGTPQWTANGVLLCNAAVGNFAPKIVSDGAGGAIVAFFDLRNNVDYDLYAQRVNGAGALQWAASGVAVATASGNQVQQVIASDGANGAIIAWADERGGANDVYAQRVGPLGVAQWTANGLPVCTATGAQQDVAIASDGVGGAVIAWDDARTDGGDIYAQRVNAAGTLRWMANGVPIAKATNNQLSESISLTSPGGAIVAWNDFRLGVDYDIYAQRVDIEEGYWGHPEPVVVSVADVKGDQGGKVKVNWTASGWDVRHMNTITHYSIWRALDVGAFQSAVQSGAVDDASKVGRDFHGTAVRKENGPNTTSYYWEWVGNQDILYSSSYSFSAATRADSTSQGAATHYFQVVSHTSDPFVFWPSNVVSGRSVDNLSPPAVLFLTAQRAGANVNLKWNRVRVPDLKNYSVYRKSSSGVTPIPINFLNTATDTVIVDSSAPTTALYYIVTAYDVHLNQGKPSNEASVSPTTGVGNTPPLTVLRVLQNRPNPFTEATELQIGLPAVSKVEIAVYDIAGRRVRDMTIKDMPAGWKNVAFDGRDSAGRPLASGVYFYKVSAGGKTITSKMVIAR